MSVPVFVSEIRVVPTDTITVGAGSTQIIPSTQFYFLISSKTTSGNGKSFLQQLGDSAAASSGLTWTFGLTSDLKIKAVHNSGGSVNLIMGRALAWNLGYAMAFSTGYPPDPTLTVTIPIAAGAGGTTAPYRSPYLWCPEVRVSMTGPELFDPMTSPGIPSKSGAIVQAPDNTAVSVTNGTQTTAAFVFKSVNPLYRARATDPNYAGSFPHEREDYETWWRLGPGLGRRFLFFREKTVVGNGGSISGFGSSSLAPDYVAYYPDAATKAKPQITAPFAPDLRYHDITVGCSITEMGVAQYA